MITTAQKTELERFTGESVSIGVEVKSNRMKTMKELVTMGLVRPVATHAGFTYFTKVKTA